jgi:glucose-specific phosphotransferase system IIA component
MSIIIYSPITGKLVPIESVSDPVFSEKMLGDGVAILPEEGVVLAPASGTISALPASGHAFGMILAPGVELLVHVGIDTVDMNGQGFTLLAAKDQQIETGQRMIEFSIDAIKAAGKDTISPVVLIGAEINVLAKDYVEAGEPLFEIIGVEL